MEHVLSFLNLNKIVDMSEELESQENMQVEEVTLVDQAVQVEQIEESEQVGGIKSFEEIAKQIIKKSIRSAICIDDRFIEPYMPIEKIASINIQLEPLNESLSSDIPAQLYRSFRKDGECDLDIYHFNNLEESWHPEYMLNNKDLVVLDWELEGKGNFESTLIILKKIIEDDKVPFVIIYTQKPKEDFFDITNNIIANFNHNTLDEQPVSRGLFYSEFYTHFIKISEDDEWEDDKVELFWEKQETISILLEYVLTPSKKEVALDLLEKAIFAEFQILTINIKSINKKFKTVLKNIFSHEYHYNVELLWYLLVDAKNCDAFSVKRINVNEIGFRINNCIVTLFSKPGSGEGVNPENVFTQFSNLISSSPHNFITLLSLEMRDRFREDFSKIGNDISQIDERAFFYHLEYYKKRSADTYKNQFYDFLLNSWTNELSEYNINLKPLIFDVIEDYQEKNNLKNLKGENIISSLADLAVKLSTTSIDNRIKRDKKIRFGDIFKIITFNGQGEIIEGEIEYALSLTPHCVCLDSCKIDNNFYFIKSEDVSDNCNSALKKIEVDHYSFVNDNQKVMAVKWGDCKPFTLYIETNELDRLNSTFMNKVIKLEYITTLQENFAQRISNKSFSYGTSIGIDLPHLSS